MQCHYSEEGHSLLKPGAFQSSKEVMIIPMNNGEYKQRIERDTLLSVTISAAHRKEETTDGPPLSVA